MNKPVLNLTRVALALSLACLLPPCLTAKAADGDKTEGQKGTQKEAVVSLEKQPNGHRWIKARILIRASSHVVWETVHEERKKDPDLSYSKVLTQDENNQSTLEQKFALIPIIGTATCVMKNSEVPFERIDYSMLSSDRFKAFEGSWVLSPGVEPNETYLELSSYCDMGLPFVPRGMIEGVTGKKLQRRLDNVRTMAEATQTRLAKK